ncbi:MAG TPA: response regulator transcription factor [Bryobacteraceae bacterium]|nr:response regulator transcription factor [Bryobacteraceae bacterium]
MNRTLPKPLRVLIVDDHALFREGVARVLTDQPNFAVESCESVDEALRLVEKQAPDVVLLDYDLGSERGSRFLPAARDLGFEGRVLVVTAWISDQEAVRLMRSGVAGIFPKENPTSALVEAVVDVARGGAWLDQRFLKLVTGVEAGSDSAELPKHLSERERKVVRALFEGLSNKEIAGRLRVSETIIKTVLQRLFQRTGVHTRGQLVRVMLEDYQDQI